MDKSTDTKPSLELLSDVSFKDYKIDLVHSFDPRLNQSNVTYRFYKTGKSHPILYKVNRKKQDYIRKLIGQKIAEHPDERNIYVLIEMIGFVPCQ